MKSCRFCRIAAGEEPAHFVLTDGISVAFLDRRPLFPGHLLLIPRQHVTALPELPPALVGPLFANARLLARVVEEGLGAEGSFVAINNRVSQSVPHLHVHVVPRRRGDGLKGFFWPRHTYSDEAAARQIAEVLRQTVARLGETDPS